jgi:hypothetical protein
MDPKVLRGGCERDGAAVGEAAAGRGEGNQKDLHMRKLLVVLALAAVPFCAGFMVGGRMAAKLPAKFESASCGFRMQAPSLGDGSHGIIAMFMADVTEEFAPNVNVMSQPAMSPADYRKLSVPQFEQLGFKILSDESGKLGARETITWEYSGKQQGRDLQFLSRAIFLPKRVLLATCTATPKQFGGMREAFKAALDSIELNPDQK